MFSLTIIPKTSEKEEKIAMLREMMNEVGSEEERRTITNIIRRMEKE